MCLPRYRMRKPTRRDWPLRTHWVRNSTGRLSFCERSSTPHVSGTLSVGDRSAPRTCLEDCLSLNSHLFDTRGRDRAPSFWQRLDCAQCAQWTVGNGSPFGHSGLFTIDVEFHLFLDVLCAIILAASRVSAVRAVDCGGTVRHSVILVCSQSMLSSTCFLTCCANSRIHRVVVHGF